GKESCNIGKQLGRRGSMAGGLKQVGVRLRACRHSKGWTLDELAERAEMSPSTLTRVESSKRQTSLELPLPHTNQQENGLADQGAPEVIDPRFRRPAIHRGGMVNTPLAPEGAQVATYKITYPPSRTAPEPRVHDGYEWLYVLSGRLRLVLGEQELTLTRGEAAEFDTRVPHSLSAAGSRPAQVISIFNDDGVRMHTHTAQE